MSGSGRITSCPHRDTQKFTAHPDGVNTGTNHFSLYLSLLFRVGLRFDRPEWVEACRTSCTNSSPPRPPAATGPSTRAPPPGYDYLTYHGVDEYTAWSGDDFGLTALRRGLDFHRDWTYPDGFAIECIDGRMRHTRRAHAVGAVGLLALAGRARLRAPPARRK